MKRFHIDGATAQRLSRSALQLDLGLLEPLLLHQLVQPCEVVFDHIDPLNLFSAVSEDHQIRVVPPDEVDLQVLV